jgi:hypothetical protein
VDLCIAAIDPAECLKSPSQRGGNSAALRIVDSYTKQHANASHTLGLLGPRRKRQRHCTTG